MPQNHGTASDLPPREQAEIAKFEAEARKANAEAANTNKANYTIIVPVLAAILTVAGTSSIELYRLSQQDRLDSRDDGRQGEIELLGVLLQLQDPAVAAHAFNFLVEAGYLTRGTVRDLQEQGRTPFLLTESPAENSVE